MGVKSKNRNRKTKSIAFKDKILFSLKVRASWDFHRLSFSIFFFVPADGKRLKAVITFHVSTDFCFFPLMLKRGLLLPLWCLCTTLAMWYVCMHIFSCYLSRTYIEIQPRRSVSSGWKFWLVSARTKTQFFSSRWRCPSLAGIPPAVCPRGARLTGIIDIQSSCFLSLKREKKWPNELKLKELVSVDAFGVVSNDLKAETLAFPCFGIWVLCRGWLFLCFFWVVMWFDLYHVCVCSLVFYWLFQPLK